ncbi:hypothetical protein L210DRAFT_949070 [Boletus edulis BED1]|uniref:Uncharacterized protein n=1 Tax=Boletus edulis BED1 TaxID=1328754 RepID=A0AAD4GDS5_BOLED|nr:hypothetical protein L210DRAFT_949070 [Boletus edulis BED1]
MHLPVHSRRSSHSSLIVVSVRKFTTKLSEDTCGFNIPSTTFAYPFKQTTLQTSSP